MKPFEPWLWEISHSQGSRHFRGRAARSERGASAVEYGLLISGIAALIAVAVFAFGGGVNGLFDDSCQTIVASTGAGSCS
jgi:pilus assembly protein Flp/PilA